MRKQTALRLKQCCLMTSSDIQTARRRYRRLKKDWNKTPSNARHQLMQTLEKAAYAMAASSLQRAAA